MIHMLVAFVFLLSFVSHAVSAASDCSTSSFSNIALFGGEIISLSAQSIYNYTPPIADSTNHYTVNTTSLDVCEVSIQYTHQGQNDIINVLVWLPIGTWNGRFMGAGGGGWATGHAQASLVWPASMGYSAVSTDGGHSINVLQDAATWGLVSPGNVNWALLQDFVAISLDDMTTLGKAVTAAFYGSAPRFSYWNGCSTGGRQGHMMAQRYPAQYNGILATAPAINWAEFLVSEYWPQFVMNSLGEYPAQCELNAITNATIQACDSLDGLEDGIILRPDLCTFDPSTLIGQTISCSDINATIQISPAAATVASATWFGPTNNNGNLLWPGLNPDAPLSGLANTTCTSPASCSGSPFSIAVDWIRVFILKNPSITLADLSNLTNADYEAIFHQSVNQYTSIIGTSDPDLSLFRSSGGKMLTWHGLSDQLIPSRGTQRYYERVRALDPDVSDYYRYFEAPGVWHCSGGNGWFPGDAMKQLVQWVENGTAPERLIAKATTTVSAERVVRTAGLCAYPKKMVYLGGDGDDEDSFGCE